MAMPSEKLLLSMTGFLCGGNQGAWKRRTRLGERARESAITTLDKANEPEEHDQYDVVVAERNTVLAVMTFSSLGGLTDVAVHRLHTRTEHYPQRRRTSLI
jgi:hypothetical protein